MRRIMMFAAILMSFAAAANAAVCLNISDGCTLVESDGNIVVDFGIYAKIEPTGGDLYIGCAFDGKKCLLASDGEACTAAEFDYMEYANGAVITSVNGKFGLLTTEGKVMNAFVFDSVRPLYGEGWLALMSGQVYRISSESNVQPLGLPASRIGTPAKDLPIVFADPEGKYGYCDSNGHIIADAVYDYAFEFSDFGAVVVRAGKHGVIDDNGIVILEPSFDRVEITADGLILAETESGIILYDTNGNEIDRFYGEDISFDVIERGFILYGNETVNVFDQYGREVGEESGSVVFREGFEGQLIASDGQWGEEAVWLWGTQQRYVDIFPLQLYADNPLYGYMKTETVLYRNDRLEDDLVVAQMDTARYGIIDRNGNIVIPARYLSVSFVGEDRFLVRTDDAWQMIDLNGGVYWSRTVQNSAE